MQEGQFETQSPVKPKPDNQPSALLAKDKKEIKTAEVEEAVPFIRLFRFATTSDWVLIVIGTIASIVNGAAMPLFSLLFGDVTNEFGPMNSPDDVVTSAGKLSLKLFGVGLGSFVASYLSFACWMISGERQAIETRKRYFKSLLSQEIAFFDSINPNELSTKIAEECFNIQGGIGEKVSTFIYSIAMFIVGFVIGYIKGWQLALILTGFLPFMMITGGLFVFTIQKFTQITDEAYSKAGAIAEEVLNAVRTVVSLGGQEKEGRKFNKALEENKKAVMKFIILAGFAIGSMFLALFGVYALGFYVGSIFINKRFINPVTNLPYNAGDVLTVFFSIVMAGFTASQASPAIKAFAIAKTAAAKAHKIIDRESKISIEDTRGQKLNHVEGDIVFKNVTFAYPLKLERTVLDGITFTVRKNEKTAFVGESGCGKTTCMQLIERFYDILQNNGSITLDGIELKDLNLKWMRENIGYVGQEPVLFATSVKENLLMAKDDATDEQIWQALKRANAYNFVQNLPEKLNTFVGTNGAMLSGGQKQRLAIARAILKDPKILLLDEATSALDRRNEMEIQKTLDEISEGRTTIVIAHRLSTIINADHIIVFDQGKVVEEGRHQDLVAKRGRYYALQHLQLQAEEKEKTKDDKIDSDQKNEEDVNKESGATESDHKKSVARQVTPRDNKASDHKHAEEAENMIDVKVIKDDKKTEEKNADKSTKDKEDKKTKEENPPVFSRLYKYNGKDQPVIIFSLVIALLNGCVFPALAILLSNMLEILALPFASDFTERANLISLMFFVMAIIAFVLNTLQTSLFNVVSENLSRKIRTEVFQKYSKMPIGWFDIPENSPGALCSKLAKDATLIKTLTSAIIGLWAQALASFISGMVIAFVASWQLTLVSLGLSPLMMIAGKMQAQFSQGFSAATDDDYKDSAAFVAEAVNNMRTVASFGKEDKLLHNYAKKLDGPMNKSVRKGNISGLFFGFSQFVNFAIYSVVFYVGAIFMRDINLSFKNMLQSVFGIMFAAMGAGNAMQFAPDVGSATNAAINIFKILDAKPAIDIDDPNQDYRQPIKGDIEFKNVWFKYPSREKQIFQNLNFKIEASKKVAFVGPSGCGKSTILALLQRFYDVDQGEILIDGISIKKYDLKHLRTSYGVVSQEPVLFNGSIEYNIKYSRENATDREMRDASDQANATGFIENNEFDVVGNEADANAKHGTGFQRKVGPKGSQLSGGQKQRIAIARAILNHPSVLILDEATSALDAQNEKAVQESLDNIMKGKTSVIVAHRISTIRDADEILVFNDGNIIERGNYNHLNEMKGVFYRLERGMDLTNK